MKKILFLLIVTFILTNSTWAKHLKGGWIQYEYLGVGANPNTSKYKITVRQYLDFNSVGAQIDQTVTLGIFDAGNNSVYQFVTIDSVVNGSVLLKKTTYNSCIEPKPSVAYLINKYETTMDLPDNAAGYILSVQRCCRIAGIVNVPNSDTVGVTYYNRIPGMINGVSYRNNSSPQFVQRDTVLLCYSSPFTFDFSAKDPDGDSLSYTFCAGLTGASSTQPGPTSPTNPPYTPIPYAAPFFDGGFPLGTEVAIDPATGIISGDAPANVGNYVLSVCVIEYRNKVMIGSTKKEIHVIVANCSLTSAVLKPVYVNCNDLKFTFLNESTNPNIIKYNWTFGDFENPNNEDSVPKPTHIYSDTGSYKLTLKVTSNVGCIDSAMSLVNAFPGFIPKFTVSGSCYAKPFVFTDATYAKYGVVNSWNWNFGDTASVHNTANAQNANHSYSQVLTTKVILRVSSSVGCVDSDTLIVTVLDSCINLPVTLSSFTATANKKTIQTIWHTSTELNTHYFLIQHSTDGSSFTDIGTVKAIGSGANEYQFTDSDPNNGINYYRLKSVDKDEFFAYSKVVSSQLLEVSKQLAVYPNPTKDFVTISGSHIISVQVLDNIGRVVKNASFKDAINPSFSVSGLPAGVYHLRVQTIDGKVSGVGILKE